MLFPVVARISCGFFPMQEISRRTLSLVPASVNTPSLLVTVPDWFCRLRTVAPISGSPSVSYTTPRMMFPLLVFVDVSLIFLSAFWAVSWTDSAQNKNKRNSVLLVLRSVGLVFIVLLFTYCNNSKYKSNILHLKYNRLL